MRYVFKTRNVQNNKFNDRASWEHEIEIISDLISNICHWNWSCVEKEKKTKTQIFKCSSAHWLQPITKKFQKSSASFGKTPTRKKRDADAAAASLAFSGNSKNSGKLKKTKEADSSGSRDVAFVYFSPFIKKNQSSNENTRNNLILILPPYKLSYMYDDITLFTQN